MSETRQLFKTRSVDGGVSITGVDVASLGNAIDLVIPETIGWKRVVEIANSAFKNCTTLRSVVIPKSVKIIGVDSFHSCSSLVRIVMSEGVVVICNNAFSNCSSLTNVVIPSSIHAIGDSTFSNCPSLYHIEIPKSVGEIGKNAFDASFIKIRYYQRSYAERWVKENNVAHEIIESTVDFFSPPTKNNQEKKTNKPISPSQGLPAQPNVVFETQEVDDGIEITGIDVSTLGNSTNLVIPPTINRKRVVAIGPYAFSECSSLTSVHIPDGVKTIKFSAFWDCSSLTSVRIPEGVQIIEGTAFSECSSLTTIHIPDGIQSIEDSAFWDCSSLTSVHIPDGVKTIGRSAFGGCSSLTSVHLPKGVQRIGDLAFWGCSSLISVRIPNGVKKIGKKAFKDCPAVLHVHKGSYVEQWAIKNNHKYEIIHS